MAVKSKMIGGRYVRSGDGNCAAVSCPVGSLCINGRCSLDRCATVRCTSDTTCRNGQCIPN
ncbi:hypothetical protein CHUAL_005090 [Chamberlinius hualienensis]